MFRIAVFLLALFALAIGFAWLADNPGIVTVQWDWLSASKAYEVTLLHAMIALVLIVGLLMVSWWLVSSLLNSPKSFGRWRSGRRRDRGYLSLSQGLIAAGAGNAALARRMAKESQKLLTNEPMVQMLDAQTALLEGRQDEARSKYEAMLENDSTKLLGLRGLYIEAEKEGNSEAAGHFSKQAYELAPHTAWAAAGLLKSQGGVGDWETALKTLEKNRASGMFKKEEYTRKRAVILTALAGQEEDINPDKARSHALAAHKLVPALVPAAVIAARLSVRLADLRKAAKIIETTWKHQPHPELAETYLHLRNGDSALDRLKRAETLAAKKQNHPEGQFAIATAAISAREWDKARNALDAILRSSPTERACLMMAQLDELEHGDRGRVREWLSRAVSAPRDAAWTADGVVVPQWAPFSPVTGELDAFEWKVPVEQLGGSANTIDFSQIPPHKPTETEDELPILELAIAAGAASAAAINTIDNEEPEKPAPTEVDANNAAEIVKPEIIDAEIIAEASAVDTKPTIDPVVEEVAVAAEEKTEISEPLDEGVVEVNGEVLPKAKPRRSKNTPISETTLDENGDGHLDQRPDDPGPKKGKKKKKGNFFF